MLQALHKRRQNFAHRSAFGLSPWWTWRADTPGWSLNRCSRTTESTPPESATVMRFPRNDRRSALALGGFLELAIAHQPLEALLDELFRLFFAQLLQRLGERLAQRLRRGLRIAVRAAQRLGNDPVDEAEGLQAARRDAERLGGLGRHLGAAPQDGGATLGRNHRVGGVLQHDDEVAHGDG